LEHAKARWDEHERYFETKFNDTGDMERGALRKHSTWNNKRTAIIFGTKIALQAAAESRVVRYIRALRKLSTFDSGVGRHDSVFGRWIALDELRAVTIRVTD